MRSSSSGATARTRSPIARPPAPGPLGGLAAALHHAREHGHRLVVTTGCDMPVLPPDLVARLLAAGCPSLLATSPVTGLWPVDLAELLDAHLASAGDRSVRRWSRSIGAVEIAATVALLNINTPADLAALTRSQGLAGVIR